MAVTFDSSDFRRRMGRLQNQIQRISHRSEDAAADELLRLSSREVPLDVGTLLASGDTGRDSQGAYVKYGGASSPYAARMHEHPEYNFQNGRKGKYLEDPLKKNKSVFQRIMEKQVMEGINRAG